MWYLEGCFQDTQAATDIVLEELVGDVVFELARNHLRVLFDLGSFTLPFCYPLWGRCSEDCAIVQQESCIQIAVVKVGPQTQLFFCCERVALLGAHLDQLFEELADLAYRQGKTADKEFANKKELTTESGLVVFGSVVGLAKLFLEVAKQQFGNVFVLKVESSSNLTPKPNLPLTHALRHEGTDLLHILR